MKNPNTAKATALRIARADWSPAIRTTVYAIAAAATAAYVAGLLTGRWVHRLNDQLASWASSRHRQSAPISPPIVAVVAPAMVIVQRQAAEPAAIAPPRAEQFPMLIHISDPMHRAIRMVRDGKSQRLAAHLCGVPRSSLQRALKA